MATFRNLVIVIIRVIKARRIIIIIRNTFNISIIGWKIIDFTRLDRIFNLFRKFSHGGRMALFEFTVNKVFGKFFKRNNFLTKIIGASKFEFI
jgi:hypothetical protein